MTGEERKVTDIICEVGMWIVTTTAEHDEIVETVAPDEPFRLTSNTQLNRRRYRRLVLRGGALRWIG